MATEVEQSMTMARSNTGRSTLSLAICTRPAAAARSDGSMGLYDGGTWHCVVQT